MLVVAGFVLMTAHAPAAQGVTGGGIQRGARQTAEPMRVGLKAEYFGGIEGSLLEDLTNHTKFLNNEADIVEETGVFEARQDWADNYGVRRAVSCVRATCKPART